MSVTAKDPESVGSVVQDDPFVYVSREQYEQLLQDYNELKEKYETGASNRPKANAQQSLEACMGRLERFEYLMKELQDNFRDIKATIRSRPAPHRTEPRETTTRRVQRDDDPVNFIMTIVHPKRSVDQRN